MSDVCDVTDVRQEVFDQEVAAEFRRAASMIPSGEPGDCCRCGEDSPRLVRGVCAPCRDKYKLP